MTVETDREHLDGVARAMRAGDRKTAGALVCAALEKNPRDVAAWMWACELAPNDEERARCLERVLALDPNHAVARRYLAMLEIHSSMPQKGISLLDVLLLPLNWLFSLSPVHWLAVAVIVTLAGLAIYTRANTTFFGLAGLDFDTLVVADGHDEFAAQDGVWRVTFESGRSSEFHGLVRHVSPIRIDRFRILTHDILVTSGDFADPQRVRTSVFNHRFTWRALGDGFPQGRINLLHAIPANDDIYRQLLALREGNVVTITGREVLVIRAYGADGQSLGEWRDAGCNTLVVESVEVEGR